MCISPHAPRKRERERQTDRQTGDSEVYMSLHAVGPHYGTCFAPPIWCLLNIWEICWPLVRRTNIPFTLYFLSLPQRDPTQLTRHRKKEFRKEKPFPSVHQAQHTFPSSFTCQTDWTTEFYVVFASAFGQSPWHHLK